MEVPERAVARFDNGHSCAQAVFSACAEELGVDYDTAVRVSCGFGGGMGRMAETCGAVTGAFMVFGLRFGGANAEAKEKTYELVRECARRFQARHGSLQCRDLLGCDISTAEGLCRAREQNLHATVCSQLVRDAATIVTELLQQPE